MKLYAYHEYSKGALCVEFYTKKPIDLRDEHVIGTVEVEEPKITVTKEAAPICVKGDFSISGLQGNKIAVAFAVDPHAKNIKCTYETEVTK